MKDVAPLAPEIRCVGDGRKKYTDEGQKCGPVELRRLREGHYQNVPEWPGGQSSYRAQWWNDSVLDQISDVLHRMLEGGPAK